MRTEGLHTVGCGVVLQGDRLRHCCYYPIAMQNSARYFPPLLGYIRTPLASICHSNPLQVSTPYLLPHPSDLRYGSPRNSEVRSRGLDLWQARMFSNQNTCCCPTDATGRMKPMDEGSRVKRDSLMLAHWCDRLKTGFWLVFRNMFRRNLWFINLRK
jgi:hypothetical protein